MSPGKRKRKLIIVLAVVLAGLALLLVTLPLWFPWVLRPIARSNGATYSGYAREGYHSFSVSDVTYTDTAVVFTAKRLRVLLPSTWAWRLLRHSHSGEAFAAGEQCSLHTIPRSDHASETSVAVEARKVNRTLATLGRWMPLASVTNGTLNLNGTQFTFPSLNWSNGTIRGQGQNPGGPGLIELAAMRIGLGAYRVEASSRELHLQTTVNISTNNTGLEVEAVGHWWSNRIDIAGQFGPKGSLPDTATVSAEQFSLRADVIGLPQYRELRGTATAKWASGGFAVDLRGTADSQPGETNLPPLRLELHARGNTNAAVIETAVLNSPALKVELSRELTVYFTGQLLRQPAHVNLDADLSRQSWLHIRGRLTGEADLTPGSGNFPEARFRVAGEQLTYEQWQTRSLEISGRFEWPQLEVSNAIVRLPDSSLAVIQGRMNLEDKAIETARVSGVGPLLKRWLPAGYDYSTLTATGQVTGPLDHLSHTGDLEVSGATSPFLKPVNLRLRWSGAETAFDNFQLDLANASNFVSAAGAVALTSNRVNMRLNSLTVMTNSTPWLTLVRPTEMLGTFAKGQTAWSIEGPALEMRGPGGTMKLAGEVSWPDSGNISVEVERISCDVITNLLSGDVPDITVSNLSARAEWNNGPATFSLALLAQGTLPAQISGKQKVTASLTALGTGKELVISNLTLSGATSAWVRAEGSLPLAIVPGGPGPLLELQTNGQMRLRARAEPQSPLWDELARRTGVGLRAPYLAVELAGNSLAPEGTVKAGAASLVLAPNLANANPNIQALDLVLELNDREARLTTGRLLVQGQPVEFAAQLPLTDALWTDIRRGRSSALTNLTGRVQVQEAQLAAFESILPAFVAPQGDLSLDLILSAGQNLRGQLRLANARTRPLGPTGPIRDIFLSLAIKNNVLSLERASGSIGAATVSVTGEAKLGGREWLEGELPPFNVSVHGIGVPLARQPEFVVRGDLLLGVTKTNGAPPLITGTARLHDSYYLSDLRDLVPVRVASPERRPPYFSIQDPVLAAWRLGVDVSGPKFLRLRSPVFNGEISANLKLQGTLKDPIALGDVRIDSGVVRFPFASLQTQQGLVTLTSQNPYHPQLSINAASKQFGYDIRMTVSGPVDAPVIQFNSTPPLSSEQILLMVSAGEMPQGTFNLTPQQRAQTVALFLGRDLLSKMGVGDETQQRLSIRSGEQISEQGRPTYQVEYKLSDKWSITGEYDRFGDYNAGVKWRVYSK